MTELVNYLKVKTNQYKIVIKCDIKWIKNDTTYILFFDKIKAKFVGNKAKGRMSKRMLQENKVRQIFKKVNIILPLKFHFAD